MIRSEYPEFPRFTTEIDYINPDNEEIVIRGKNLSEMIQDYDFIDTIFHTLLDKRPTPKEKKLLNASLTSFHTGFQAYPPTLLFPRIAASTGATIPQAIAAGYCSSGEYHLGAIKRSMQGYLELEKLVNSTADPYQETSQIIQQRITQGEKIFGFGHPILKEDPRPKVLRDLATKLSYTSTYLTIYDAVRDTVYQEKKQHPNVDGINASLLLSLGFKPDHGEGLFLFSRTIGMIAHIVEEKERPPWSAWRSLNGREMVDNLTNQGAENATL